jgi:RNA polymerase sigma-70 factor (ECF subfamily)
MNEPSSAANDVFPVTRWSVVQAASSDRAEAGLMLEELCRKYWKPICLFIRSRVPTPDDAEDLAQDYFANLLARGYLSKADPNRGRFRAFLVQDLKYFLSGVMQKRMAAKRGEGIELLSLNEARIVSGPAATDTATETAFDREWALMIAANAREQLRASYDAAGKGNLFRVLQHGLVKIPDAAEYEKWAVALSITTGSLRVALHRLRNRFHSELKTQVMETVSSEDDFEEEMRHLRKVLLQVLPEA